MIFPSNAAARRAMTQLVQTHGAALLRGGFKTGRVLGCGRQGCVAKATTGRVVKLTVSEDEASLSQWLAAFGAGLPRMLPRIFRVGVFETESVYVIEREDLSDPPWDPRGRLAALQVVGAAVDDLGCADLAYARGAPGAERLYLGAIHALESVVDAQSLSREVREAARDALALREWQEEHSVAIFDLWPRNWGWRAPPGGLFVSSLGRLVIRDIGIARHPEAFEAFGRRAEVEVVNLRGLIASPRFALRGARR